MTAKEYLSRYKGLDMLINAKTKELSKLRAQKDVKKVVMLECIINADIDRLLETKHEIINAIKGVSNPFYQAVLLKKYISGETLDQIAEATHYSTKQISRMHKSALEEMEKIIHNTEKQ